MKNSKSKRLKAIGFSSLALLMGFGATMAFAPLGNVAPASLEASQPTDVLVTPKEDDPVLFTTEDGLEIKWGNAASLQGGGKETWSASKYTTYDSAKAQYSATPDPNSVTVTKNLTSGNLNGFPYFTTTSGSTTYTWVIIGRNSSLTKANVNTLPSLPNYSSSASSAKIEYKSLNDWKAKIGNADTYDNFVAGYSPTYKSFFNNTYETTSPAGAAINNNGLLSAVTARNYSASISYTYQSALAISQVKTSTEIPSGCVLVLANGNVTTGVYNTAYKTGSSYYCQSYKGTENIKTAMEGYYTNGTYGLSAIKSRIQAITVKTYTYYQSGSSWNWYTDSAASQHVYPLGVNKSSTFYWANYLTAAQMKLTANQWIRGYNYTGMSSSGNYLQLEYLDTNAKSCNFTTGGTKYYANSSLGYRPAFVLKVT